VALNTALDGSADLGSALRSFSRARAPEARVLVELSRSFDYGGFRSFLTFILPLILDGISHGAAPRLFAPNTLAMLQKPELSFSHIRWRKRADRALQIAILAAAAAALAKAAALALGLAVRAVARTALPPAARPLALALPLAVAAAAALSLRRKMGGDVADVMAATSKPGEDAEGAATPG